MECKNTFERICINMIDCFCRINMIDCFCRINMIDCLDSQARMLISSIYLLKCQTIAIFHAFKVNDTNL